jgi:hypothetical protein
MMKVPLTQDDLLVQLEDQINFLVKSAVEYDKGHEAEAKRMAVSIRILLHDTGSSISLLRQLGVKSASGTEATDMPFADTSRDYDPHNLLEVHHSFNGLVTMLVGGSGTRYLAPLSQPSHGRILKSTFPDWWNKVVYIDMNRENFTRRDLVLAVTNKDGGAHVDPELDQRYADFSRNNSLGWVLSKNGVEHAPLIGPVYPSIRQIAHELLLSLNNVYPQYFGLKQQSHSATTTDDGTS